MAPISPDLIIEGMICIFVFGWIVRSFVFIGGWMGGNIGGLSDINKYEGKNGGKFIWV